jgi:hypothetical protein
LRSQQPEARSQKPECGLRAVSSGFWLLTPGFLFLALSAFPPFSSAEIIDRIAVSVSGSVITTSDLSREISVTAFQSGVTPDFSSANRRATAERMVDQKLIRRELESSHYPTPDAKEGDLLLRQLRSRYKNDAEFQQALVHYGITEQDLRDELQWELTLLRFIDVRFRPGVRVSDQEIQQYFEKEVKPAAEAANPGKPVTLADFRDRIEETLTGQRTDQQVDNWLQEVRKRTEIVFHQEAFQ